MRVGKGAGGGGATCARYPRKHLGRAQFGRRPGTKLRAPGERERERDRERERARERERERARERERKSQRERERKLHQQTLKGGSFTFRVSFWVSRESLGVP